MTILQSTFKNKPTYKFSHKIQPNINIFTLFKFKSNTFIHIFTLEIMIKSDQISS